MDKTTKTKTKTNSETKKRSCYERLIYKAKEFSQKMTQSYPKILQNTGGSLQIAESPAQGGVHIFRIFRRLILGQTTFHRKKILLVVLPLAADVFFDITELLLLLLKRFKWVVNYDLTLKTESLAVFCFCMKKSRKIISNNILKTEEF